MSVAANFDRMLIDLIFNTAPVDGRRKVHLYDFKSYRL